RTGAGDALRVKVVRVLGWGESDAAGALREGDGEGLLARGNDTQVGVTASAGELAFRIRATGSDAEAKLARAAARLREVFGALCVSEDDESVAAATLRMLHERRETLAVVESCTGGLVGAMLTEVPGAGDSFL